VSTQAEIDAALNAAEERLGIVKHRSASCYPRASRAYRAWLRNEPRDESWEVYRQTWDHKRDEVKRLVAWQGGIGPGFEDGVE
jgi:hypothetical protein